MSKTFYEKVLEAHTVAVDPVAGRRLLFVDRHYIDETCFTCFDALRDKGRRVRRPELTYAFADHTVPTRGGRAAITDGEIAVAVDRLTTDCADFGIKLFGIGSPLQGIAHVSAPDQGLSAPGLIVVGSDSHMPTHGGVGAIGIGIGLSEQTHVLATQTLWHQHLATMRIRIDGALNPHISAKDVILSVIARLGAGGAIGHAVEFDGTAVTAMSVEQRMTICNMMVEGGARTAFVAPDAVTLAYLAERKSRRVAGEFDRLAAEWMSLRSDEDARFDREERFVATDIVPMVTWGTSPQDAVPVDSVVPDPATATEPTERERRSGALNYMGLVPGTQLTAVGIDTVFIGSCTNGRIEDLRAAAAVLKGRCAVVPGIVVPGSQSVKAQAEAEGLADIFKAAGLQWRDAGCSMCAAMNGDFVNPGQRCASTSNRNFRGRQGPGSRTHLMSPAMAAAAAVTGRIADVRALS